jgi:hypothetical protein
LGKPQVPLGSAIVALLLAVAAINMVNGITLGAAVAAALAAIVAAIVASISFWLYWRDRKKQQEREQAERELWRNPIDCIEYLLPLAHYPFREFPGGPEKERAQPALTVGLGNYLVAIRFWTKTEVDADDVIFSWTVPPSAISDLGEVNPFIVNSEDARDGGINYQNWWGEWGHKGPQQVFQPHVAWVRFHMIEAHVPCSGHLEITFRIRGHDPVTKRLPFAVVENPPRDTRYLHNYKID